MKTIWTIGHSNRNFEEFTALLQTFKIEILVDVRHYPGSRKFPHFNKENLAQKLPEIGIEYHHLVDLGGRRKVQPDSKNDAWRLDSFRGYADYMETESFRNALEKLKEYAASKRTTYMCSEAVWWRCHRSLISDILKVEGWNVMHIINLSAAKEHPFTAPAKIKNGKLDYSK